MTRRYLESSKANVELSYNQVERRMNELQEFLRQKQSRAGKSVDWDARRRDWIESVERLYNFITKELLADSIQEGLVQPKYVPRELTEDYIGPYITRELILKIGDELVFFTPLGRNIVGADGRVDLRGERDEIRLIRDQSLSGTPGEWSIANARFPSIEKLPLDRANLLSILKRVMRP